MKCDTTRFGQIDVPDDKVFDFPEGMIGFSHLKRFVVIKHKNSESIYWLQSLEKPEIAFPMIYPFIFLPDYAPELNDYDYQTLKMSRETVTKAEIYNVTIIPADPMDMSVNLFSPVFINPVERVGKQVILEGSGYPVDFRILREIAKKATQDKTADKEKSKDNAHTKKKKE
jgi:flagellar assembly factor FliW